MSEWGTYRAIPISEFMRQQEAEVKWLWDTYLPEEALCLLSAFMKVGKSTFLYPLLISIARGEPFVGFPTAKANILILAVEEHPRDIKIRLANCGWGEEEEGMFIHSGPLNPTQLLQVAQDIEKHQIKLVVLDTLSKYWNVDDENDNAKVGKAITPLLDLCRAKKVCVLLIHHDNKAGGSGGRQTRGAGALFAQVDQGLFLSMGREENVRKIESLGRYTDTPKELYIEWVGDGFRRVGANQDVERQNKVWEALPPEGAPPIDKATLALSCGLKEGLVYKALRGLGQRVTSLKLPGAGRKLFYRRSPLASLGEAA